MTACTNIYAVIPCKK